MFLKCLDVIGFKSFAERISVDFVKGVTAVVGSNGSGKATSLMRSAGCLVNSLPNRSGAARWKISFLLAATCGKAEPC